MENEWRGSIWGEEISLEYGKALRGHDNSKGRYRVFGANGPIGWTSEPLAQGPGVILGRKGAYRGVQYSREPFFVIDTAYYVVPKRDLDMRWLYYAINHYKLGEIDDGSPIPSTTRAAVYMLDLDVPPIYEQQAIAHILGSLDDKIELNRRMSETLEAIARALFKSWFVDFDPVRAKAEGREPGLPKPIADLFPDSFEDSELGEIPKGWEVVALGDFVLQRVERCAASPETAARPYVPIDCISPKSLFLRESKPGEEAQSSLTKFYKGDILFGAMRPYFHKVCIAPFDGTTRTTAFVLYPRRADDFAFATLLLHHPDTIDFATRHSTGSTIPYAVWMGSLDTMPVIAPPIELRKAFNHLVRPILARIPEPYFENRTLAALRDTLLPNLISGELRISDTERILAGVDA
jgi:type I restriction enzyme S subunit